MALLLSSDLLPFSQRGVRLDAELGEGLDRLKTERHVNLISWVRSAPWVETPWGLEDGSWGSRFDGDTRALPDDPVGRVIGVTTKGEDSWTTTVVEVLQWEEDFVVVRDSGKG